MNIATTTSDRYRFDHPTIATVLSDMRIPKSDPGPGDQAPTFDLPTTDGGKVSSDDLAQDGRPVLLVFGSLTCPVTESAGDGLRELHARYGDRVRFVMVNVREAHPGSTTRQPGTSEDKLRNAIALEAHHGFPFEVAVDDIDGTVHRSFGPRPSSAYLIDASGTIVFRAHWSNVTDALEEALVAVVAKKAPPHGTVSRTFRSVTKMAGYADIAFDAAGKGARLDTWKVAPPFGAMILVSRLFGFLPRSRRGLPAIVTMMALGAAVVAGAILVL